MTCKSSEWQQSRERYCFKIQPNWERTPPQAPACSASPLLTLGSQTQLRPGFPEQPEREPLQNRHMEHTEHPELDGPTGIIQSNSWQLNRALVLCRESPRVGAGGACKAPADSISSSAGCPQVRKCQELNLGFHCSSAQPGHIPAPGIEKANNNLKYLTHNEGIILLDYGRQQHYSTKSYKSSRKKVVLV